VKLIIHGYGRVVDCRDRNGGPSRCCCRCSVVCLVGERVRAVGIGVWCIRKRAVGGQRDGAFVRLRRQLSPSARAERINVVFRTPLAAVIVSAVSLSPRRVGDRRRRSIAQHDRDRRRGALIRAVAGLVVNVSLAI